MKHDYGFQAAPSQMPPDRAPISKAPANENDDADFMAGMIEYRARSAIADLKALLGFDGCREHVAMILNDLAGGRRNG